MAGMAAPAYELATTPSFWKSLDELDKSTRRAVLDTIDKLHEGNPSTHVHKLNALPFVACGVSQNAYRIICHRQDETLVLCHVGKHDPAYDWARRHKLVQVGRAVRILRTTLSEVDQPAALVPAANGPSFAPAGPLASLTDDLLSFFEVGPGAAAALRALPDEDALVDLLTHFPAHRAEALLSLALEPERTPELQERYLAAASDLAEKKATPLRDALADEINSAALWAISPEDEACRRALEGDFAAWRVFLHPSQKRLARMDARGAVKITGGPGTGKTVVALHRARHLAELRLAQDPRPVLLTTFSSALARQLESQRDELCRDAPALRERIVVRSLVRVAQEVLDRAGLPHGLVTDVAELWQGALAHDAAGRGRAFYESEREQVVARLGAWTEKAYLEASRAGRPQKLDRAGRHGVWKVLDAFERALAAEAGGDVTALARDAAAALDEGRVPSPYSAVVCDEVQDVGASELRLLAALARDRESRAIRPNALTLAGDGLQRIYRVPASLLSCGIETRGRSRTLRLNYRTTEAIRRAAVAIVAGARTDALDEDSASSLDGYRSLRPGTSPEERTFPSRAAEADWIAELARDEASGALLVLARTGKYVEELADALRSRAVAPRILGADDVPLASDRVLVATMHRSKGLESARVVIAGRQLVPARYVAGEVERDEWERRERCLLYVGMTRARDWCAVSTVAT